MRTLTMREIVEVYLLVLLFFGNPNLLPVRMCVERYIELGVDVFQFGGDSLEGACIGKRDFIDIARDNLSIFGIDRLLLVERRCGGFGDKLVEFRVAVAGRVGVRDAALIAQVASVNAEDRIGPGSQRYDGGVEIMSLVDLVRPDLSVKPGHLDAETYRGPLRLDDPGDPFKWRHRRVGKFDAEALAIL